MPASTSTVDVLVGRAAELAVLRNSLDAAVAGRVTMVLLVGEPGIGKTRLADEAAGLARAAGMRVLRGEADAAVREPMELWRGVYRTLGVEAPNDPTLPAADRRWEHLEALAEGLRCSAPALVVLEDLHWADDMAVWVLGQLPRVLDAPIAAVATSRDREPDMPGLDPLRRVSRVVHLGGLDVDAVGELVTVDSDLSVDVCELHARTGGNPLFVRELLHNPGGGLIDEVLDRALARFDEPARLMLATAALAGAGAPLAIVAAATSTTAAEASDRLASAVRGGVLDEVTRSGVRFRHALLADAAARWADARELHTRLAAAWEVAGGLSGRTSAAAHRLRAAEDASAVVDAIGTALDVAAELVIAGEQPRAAGLLSDTRDAALECVDRPELRARVALALADVLGWLGNGDLATQHYEEAATLSRDGSNVALRARAEISAALGVIWFIPDPERMHRLRELLAGIPPGELGLRATLLSRLAVVAATDLEAADSAHAWADEAVTTARRTGDPVLILEALIHQQELEARPSIADEVISLAERAGRSDFVVQGHQWRYCHHLNHGDVVAANRALGRAELIAGLLPSPGWRYSTLIRRTTLLAVSGDRAGATVSMTEAARVGAGTIEPRGLVAFEIAHRLMLLDLYGGTDPHAEQLYHQLVQMAGDSAVPFVQIHLAHAAQAIGDDDRVTGVLQRYASEPDRVMRSLFGEELVRLLGDIVARAGARTFVEPIYGTLLRCAGLLNTAGTHVGLPVDDILGRLAALAGDTSSAVRHAEDAVALARSMPSSPLLVHCLDHLGDALARAGERRADAVHSDAEALAATVGVELAGREHATGVRDVPARVATMLRDGGSWSITSPLGNARLPESTGLGQLVRLVSMPRVEVTAVELAGGSGAPAADLGPALDAQAKRVYRQRLLELQAEVDDAASCNDFVRGERAQVEIDALLRELERAVGLGGRDRPTASGAERARINVLRSIKRAIAAIGHQAPELAAHLEVSVRTRRYCAYQPEPAAALSWVVQT